MDYAHFEEGTRPLGPAFELSASEPESPFPPWQSSEFERALLVVAHPDDEILFAGGLMLHYPEWEWTVATVTDPGREWQQEQVWQYMARWGVNVDAHNLGFIDGWVPAPKYRKAILDDLLALDIPDPDIVFTHGYRGEYGHHAHVWTHHAVHLGFQNVWDFYHPCSRLKQLRKTLIREIPVDGRKRNIFGLSYGQVATGLRKNAPWVTERMDACKPEYFTQAVVGI